MGSWAEYTWRRGTARRLRASRDPRARAVFAVPVTPSPFVSHQWLRELRRRSQGAIATLYFRVPDEQPVWVGHYGGEHRELSAAEAVAIFLAADTREGWQVMMPRRIEAAEIFRVKWLLQVVGWR